jgi:hypothetical protein
LDLLQAFILKGLSMIDLLLDLKIDSPQIDCFAWVKPSYYYNQPVRNDYIQAKKNLENVIKNMGLTNKNEHAIL